MTPAVLIRYMLPLQMCGRDSSDQTAYEYLKRFCYSCFRSTFTSRQVLSETIRNTLAEDEYHLVSEIDSFLLIQPGCVPSESFMAGAYGDVTGLRQCMMLKPILQLMLT